MEDTRSGSPPGTAPLIEHPIGPMRSLLFVPADAPAKIVKALASPADVVIIDLEDSVAASARPMARRNLIDALRDARRERIIVRVNGLATGETDLDLDAAMTGAPLGIMLPKSMSGIDVQHLGTKIAVREAERGLPDGRTGILPVATETAAALFTLGTYAGASRRLMGLTWGAEDLSADIGAETNKRPDGSYADPYRLARTLTLLGAAAAGVAAIDTVFVAFRDEAGLRAECEGARADGFSAKMAIHPAQVATINAAFTPSDEAVRQAQAVVAAFASDPGAGVAALDGAMIDRPHLLRARRVLARLRSAV